MHPEIANPRPGTRGGPHGKLRRAYIAVATSSVVVGILASPTAEAFARIRMHAR